MSLLTNFQDLVRTINLSLSRKADQSEVSQNTAARHTHSNKSVLDKLGNSGSNLQYDGVNVNKISDVRSQEGYSLVSDGIATIPDSRIFWAYYNSTTFDQLLSAYDAGKIILMRNTNYSYSSHSIYYAYYFGRGSDRIFKFFACSTSANVGSLLDMAQCSENDGWSNTDSVDFVKDVYYKNSSIVTNGVATMPVDDDLPYYLMLSSVTSSSATMKDKNGTNVVWGDIRRIIESGRQVLVYVEQAVPKYYLSHWTSTNAEILTDSNIFLSNTGNLTLYARYFWWDNSILNVTELSATYNYSSNSATWKNVTSVVGSSEISIGNTQPTGDEIVWYETNSSNSVINAKIKINNTWETFDTNIEPIFTYDSSLYSTNYSNCMALINAGKKPVLLYNGVLYRYCGADTTASPKYIAFSGLSGSSASSDMTVVKILNGSPYISSTTINLQTKLPDGSAANNVLKWSNGAWGAGSVDVPSQIIAQSTAPSDTSALWIDIDDETVDGTIVDGSNMAF